MLTNSQGPGRDTPIADRRRAPVHVRALTIGVALIGAVAGLAATSAAAPGPEVAIFHAPAGAPPPAPAIKRALADGARREGIAWIDASAPADPPPETIARIRRGATAYAELRFEAAIADLDAAAIELAASGAIDLAPADISDLFLFRGLARVQLGDVRAWDDLVAAAAIDPSRVLDPQVFPPRAIESFARAVTAAQAAGRAALTITAPAGCAIAIDGAGAADGRAEVVRGPHYATARCPGYRPWGSRVIVDADRAIAPSLTVEAAPTDAELAIQLRTAGATAAIAIRIAGPVCTLRHLTADGRVVAQAAIALDQPRAVDAAVAAFVALAHPAAPVRATRWWRSPWLWGAAGAAVATAVLLPFALGGDGGAGAVTLRPTGLPTW